MKSKHNCINCKRPVKNFYSYLCRRCYLKTKGNSKISKHCGLCNKKFETYISENRKFCCLSHAYTDRSKQKYFKTKNLLKNISRDFIVWFTGFWEGEGCLSIRPERRNYYLTISQKDKTIMKLIQRTFRFGQVQPHSTTKYNYTWNIYNFGEILALIECMNPFIKLKHRKLQIYKSENFIRIKELKKYV